jgi:hypothetical protein
MANNDLAKQKIWHKAYEKALETITSLRNHNDFKYQKDANGADTVYVLNAFIPTAKQYVPGTDIERQAVDSSRKEIKMDQKFYFNIELDDVDAVQSVPGALEAAAEEGARVLAEQGDIYTASLIKAGVEDDSIATVAGGTITKTNAIEKVEEAFAVLYGNNVKPSSTFYLELKPKFFTLFRQNLTEVYTNNVEMAKKGYVGKYGNALVSIENLLPSTTAGDINVLRTGKAIAFVEQLKETKHYEPEGAFSKATKALYVFGGKVLNPEQIVGITSSK